MSAPARPGKDGLYHRVRMAGVFTCGALERNGARGLTINKLVTCPKCLGLIAERQAEAKRRAGVA